MPLRVGYCSRLPNSCQQNGAKSCLHQTGRCRAWQINRHAPGGKTSVGGKRASGNRWEQTAAAQNTLSQQEAGREVARAPAARACSARRRSRSVRQKRLDRRVSGIRRRRKDAALCGLTRPSLAPPGEIQQADALPAHRKHTRKRVYPETLAVAC